MNVVWKRPDGFHGATPADFIVIELDGHSKLWLHRRDKDQFPFRIAGGWEEDVATRRLNNLINLLEHPSGEWTTYLANTFNHSIKDGPKEFFADLMTWVDGLKGSLKGDKWEVEIMAQAVAMIEKKLLEVQKPFLKAVAT